MVSALVLTLLAAQPDLHGGAAVGLGLGVPFRTAEAGFQFSVKAFGEAEVQPKLGVGLVVPICFGFFNQAIGFGSTATYFAFDVMPGVRGSFAVLDWVRAVVELGLGPSFLNVRAQVFNTVVNQSRTDFGMRGALSVEIAPPSLSGLMIVVEPLAMQGRFASSSFPDYRFSVGVGYRR